MTEKNSKTTKASTSDKRHSNHTASASQETTADAAANGKAEEKAPKTPAWAANLKLARLQCLKVCVLAGENRRHWAPPHFYESGSLLDSPLEIPIDLSLAPNNPEDVCIHGTGFCAASLFYIGAASFRRPAGDRASKSSFMNRLQHGC